MNEKDEEIAALTDEIRYLRNARQKAQVYADAVEKRAHLIGVPCVEVIQKGPWFRIFVNGTYVDGQESAESAEAIARRLREAFTLSNDKKLQDKRRTEQETER